MHPKRKIYIIGMSHAIHVIKAFSANALSFSHENWSSFSTEGKFFDVPINPAAYSGISLKAFIISPASGWGGVAQFVSNEHGAQTIAAVSGFIDLLKSIEDESILFTFINGNEHAVLSMLQHPNNFDFDLPTHEELDLLPDRQIVPLDVISNQINTSIDNSLAVLYFMRLSLQKLKIIHVMPPPPISSHDHIKKFPEIFGQKIHEFGITPLSIRLKYYFLYQEIISAKLKMFEIQALMPPKQAMNLDGSLLESMAFGCTHGNELYASCVADQINHYLLGEAHDESVL